MNTTVMAFSLAGLMTCLGMVLRSKWKLLGKLLIPVNVIAGVLGLIYMNTIHSYLLPEVTVSEYNLIVNELFTYSFISIGLATIKQKKEVKPDMKGASRAEKKAAKKESGGNTFVKGCLGMGLLWSLLFGFTCVVGVSVIYIVGPVFGMDPMYGMLIPYAFCQGPGQAGNMGMIFEELYGLPDAQMVGLTFAVVGFVVAFGFGVPLAKYGLKKKLQISNAKISESVERGYYLPEEQREPIGKLTTHSGNIETLALHVALMGVSYILAVVMAYFIAMIPGLGPSFASMLFVWGMVAGSLVNTFMEKTGCHFLLNKSLQNKITGWTSDFLVVSAFMAIEVGVVGKWIVPIVMESIVVAAVTLGLVLFFTSRFGSDHDFERALGMYGVCTGTTPSGIALLRIVDPKLQTETATELGMMNLFMTLVAPVTIVITMLGTGSLTLNMALGLLAIISIGYAILMKVSGTCGKPTFNLRTGEKFAVHGSKETKAGEFLQGMLRHDAVEPSGSTL